MQKTICNLHFLTYKNIIMKKWIMIVLVGFLATSCTVGKYYSARSMPISKDALPYNPVIADLNVDITKKITGKIKAKGVSLEDAKQLAIFDAMENSGADVVVEPVFKVITKKTKRTAEVTGYYGKYINVHEATSEELDNLLKYREAMSYQSIFVPSNAGQVTNKKGLKGMLGQ